MKSTKTSVNYYYIDILGKMMIVSISPSYTEARIHRLQMHLITTFRTFERTLK